MELLGFVEIISCCLILFLFPLCATVLKYRTDARGIMSGILSMSLAIPRNSGNIKPWKIDDDGIWLDKCGMQTMKMEIYLFFIQRYQPLW